MKTSLLVLALSMILSVAQAASKVETVNVPGAPAFAELDRYPVYKAGRTYSPEQVAEVATRHGFELCTQKLRGDFSGLMWDGKKLSPATLPAGTRVLVDKDGKPRYKAACLNRLVAYPVTPCPVTACPQPKSNADNKPAGILERLSNALKSAALGVWKGLGYLADSVGKLLGAFGWMAILLLGLMFLPLLAYLLYRLFRAMRGNGSGGAGTLPPNQGAPDRVPTQPQQTAVPPQQAVTGTPTTGGQEEFFETNFVNGEMRVTTRNFEIERIRFQKFPDGTSRFNVTRA